MSIGQSAFRIDAPGKVTGETLYAGDIDRENFLHAKVAVQRSTPRPHDQHGHSRCGSRSRCRRHFHSQRRAGQRIWSDDARPTGADRP